MNSTFNSRVKKNVLNRVDDWPSYKFLNLVCNQHSVYRYNELTSWIFQDVNDLLSGVFSGSCTFSIGIDNSTRHCCYTISVTESSKAVLYLQYFIIHFAIPCTFLTCLHNTFNFLVITKLTIRRMQWYRAGEFIPECAIMSKIAFCVMFSLIGSYILFFSSIHFTILSFC